jgi:hypothetical protein
MKRFLIVFVLASALLGLLAAPALAGAATFTVRPSGGDDTANIQQAFVLAVLAGPGSTVQLSKGHFYMNNILVDGFRGCFTGAGMGRTVIDTLRGLNPGLPGVTLMADPDKAGDLTGWTFLIGFLRSDVRVSDMSCDITAAKPSVDWGEGDWAGQTNLSDVFVVMRDSNSAFDRVGITAHQGDVNGFNIEGALVIADTGGVHSVTRCCFTGNNGPEIGNLAGARLTIGGSPAMGNRFDMFSFGGFFTDISDSRVEISNNTLRAVTGAGIYIAQTAFVAQLKASRAIISNNRIEATSSTVPDGSTSGAAGIILEDDPLTANSPVRLQAVVAGNTIMLDNGGRAGGIDGLGARGVYVLDNRISGTGIAGIDAGTDIYASFDYPAAPANGWRILGNDVSGVNPVNAYGGHAAPIWLGKGATHCLVVGGRAPTSVLDQGTDNILINVDRLSAGSSARAAGPVQSLNKTMAWKQVKRF